MPDKAIITPQQFRKRLLEWFDQHGRKHLPWQHNKTAYRVWISEIMLQQTQVATVIPYYERFMQHFPTVRSLADAEEDAVLHLWAGLGYYSRARNLHRAAKMVMTDFGGKFPDNVIDLQKLPGIGPSTSGAIAAIAFNQPSPILDGNVKRVLSRLHGIIDPINSPAVEAKLWDLAERYTPKERVADYTQAMMDLGATLCTRSKPDCTNCFFQKKCFAYQHDLTASIPQKKATVLIPTREASFIIIRNGEHVLLEKRPASGIWGGLWCLPQIDAVPTKAIVRDFCKTMLKSDFSHYETLDSFRHTFSHYHLMLHPILITLKKPAAIKIEAGKQIWYNPFDPEPIGLPKPIQSIMRLL